MTQMPAKRKPRVTDHSLSTIEQVKKQVAKDIAKGPSKTHQLIINLSADGMEGITYASRRYRTTKSHIAGRHRRRHGYHPDTRVGRQRTRHQ